MSKGRNDGSIPIRRVVGSNGCCWNEMRLGNELPAATRPDSTQSIKAGELFLVHDDVVVWSTV